MEKESCIIFCCILKIICDFKRSLQKSIESYNVAVNIHSVFKWHVL